MTVIVVDTGPLACREEYLTTHSGARYGAPLSKRQAETLRLLAEGYTLQEVAYRMEVAYQTAKNQMREIRVKTGAPTTTRAAVLWDRIERLS